MNAKKKKLLQENTQRFIHEEGTKILQDKRLK